MVRYLNFVIWKIGIDEQQYWMLIEMLRLQGTLSYDNNHGLYVEYVAGETLCAKYIDYL